MLFFEMFIKIQEKFEKYCWLFLSNISISGSTGNITITADDQSGGGGGGG